MHENNPMSSLRAALVAAILEAPDDDTPRLIAADWFEEQGGEANAARAEFIRIQIQRSRLPPEDIRQSSLQARELRLLKRWAPVWCGSHFVFKKVRFRRGFIEYVHLHLQHFLHHRRQMFALEPVRDVSLTGWYRAPDDLVRRVAGCEEWKYIDTLRIHHQGPHHDPRSNLIELLESPHLIRLRALHCRQVQFEREARRRFERLSILRHITELQLPYLDRWPQDPGTWFSDGGIQFVHQWDELEALTLPYINRLDLLRQMTEAPFWDRLTRLTLYVSGYQNDSEMLLILRDRMPSGLRELRLSTGVFTSGYQVTDSFLQRLAQVPLQTLHLNGIPIRPATLGHLLDGTGRWDLRELRLSDVSATEDHARVIAGSMGVKNLRSLDFFGNEQFGNAAARQLFSSEYLRSLIHLNLEGTDLGVTGVQALASAPGWERLRSLKLPDTRLTNDCVRTLVVSPNLAQLVWLSLGGNFRQASSSLAITPDFTAALNRLPNLACLYLNVASCDERMRKMFSDRDAPSWTWIMSDDRATDDKFFRAFWAPEQWPPVDDTWDLGYQWVR